MSLTVLSVAPRFSAAQYDGTNGADVVDLFDATLISDDGQTLVFEHPNEETRTFTAGKYFLYRDRRSLGGYNDIDGENISPERLAVDYVDLASL